MVTLPATSHCIATLHAVPLQIGSLHAVQCCCIQFHAMPCRAMPCHALRCHAMPCACCTGADSPGSRRHFCVAPWCPPCASSCAVRPHRHGEGSGHIPALLAAALRRLPRVRAVAQPPPLPALTGGQTVSHVPYLLSPHLQGVRWWPAFIPPLPTLTGRQTVPHVPGVLSPHFQEVRQYPMSLTSSRQTYRGSDGALRSSLLSLYSKELRLCPALRRAMRVRGGMAMLEGPLTRGSAMWLALVHGCMNAGYEPGKPLLCEPRQSQGAA